MPKKKKRALYADDATESVPLLLRIRLPWLVVGLIMSFATAAVVSRYEEILSIDTRVAFFMPLIVYISAAVGTQTSAIYIHNLHKKQARFTTYIFKELTLGIILGIVFGMGVGIFTNFWLKSSDLAVAVFLAILISISGATVFSLAITALLNKTRSDPATGAEPIFTVIQDTLSLMIYFWVISLIVG